MTAVQRLENELLQFNFTDGQKLVLTILLNKALEMEKQQIIEAHGIKTTRGECQGIFCWESKTGEQYYNETYKKDKL